MRGERAVGIGYNRGMCGRFALKISPGLLAKMFGLTVEADVEERYNIGPGQEIACVRLWGAEQETGKGGKSSQEERELRKLRWGLVPSWVKAGEEGKVSSWINARSETVGKRPAFREAFRQRRCLIPASGFYEWQKAGGRKQPYYFQLSQGEGFAFAGLWERWLPAEESRALETCAILTTAANELIQPIHDRMPVIVGPNDFGMWLDPKTGPEKLAEVMRPYPAECMEMWAVSRRVNKIEFEGPECLTPMDQPQEGLF